MLGLAGGGGLAPGIGRRRASRHSLMLPLPLTAGADPVAGAAAVEPPDRSAISASSAVGRTRPAPESAATEEAATRAGGGWSRGDRGRHRRFALPELPRFLTCGRSRCDRSSDDDRSRSTVDAFGDGAGRRVVAEVEDAGAPLRRSSAPFRETDGRRTASGARAVGAWTLPVRARSLGRITGEIARGDRDWTGCRSSPAEGRAADGARPSAREDAPPLTSGARTCHRPSSDRATGARDGAAFPDGIERTSGLADGAR